MDDAKQAARAAARATRGALDVALRAAASDAICAHLLAHPPVDEAACVVGYAPAPDEVDIVPVLEAVLRRGARVLLPRVADDVLELVEVTSMAGLVAGYRGILEPVGAAAPEQLVPDVVLVPGLAFDPTGGRLGQGGGHYDRLLARLGQGAPSAPLRIGIAFTAQLVHDVPRAPHDEAVDLLVTEDGVVGGRQVG